MEKTFHYVNGADLLEQANKEAERLAEEEKTAKITKCGNALLAFLNEKTEEGNAIRAARIKAEESELEKNTEGIYAFFTAEKIATLIKNKFKNPGESTVDRDAWIYVHCYGDGYDTDASIIISPWEYTTSESLRYNYRHSCYSTWVGPDTVRKFILNIVKQLGLKNPHYGESRFYSEYLYFSW